MALARNVSAAQAARYYDHDDYYARDDVAGLEREDGGPALSPSAWHGEGAKALGLNGPVDAQMFRALGRGELPDGSQLHTAGSGARRAGTDFEFSAPKSFSIQALAMGDERLVRVHQQAVASARRHIEHLTATRVMRNGKSTLENTKKAVPAHDEPHRRPATAFSRHCFESDAAIRWGLAQHRERADVSRAAAAL